MRTSILAAAGATALVTVAAIATAVPAEAGTGDHQRHASPAQVLAWNEIAVTTGLTVTQTIQESVMRTAYMQAAVVDAVVALDGEFRPYTGHLRAHGRTDGDAAVAAAAHRILVAQYPSQQATLDAAYATSLAAVPEGPPKARGLALGENAAADVEKARAHDGFEASVPYTFGSGPGVWILPTDNPVTTPATPWAARMTPFIMRRPDQYRPGPPPDLTSVAYTAAFNETKAYGSATSTIRTPAQTEVAQFWGLGRPDAQYNAGIRDLVTTHGLDRAEAARALALTNLVVADAYIACFDGKYTYSRWRPFTAIRAADTDSNPDTVADPTWTPLVRTPNHPEYPANHSCATTSFALTVDNLLGPRRFSVTLPGTPGSTALRHYSSSAELITEIGNARVWGGVHFRYSTDAGTAIGRSVARFDFAHALQPTRD